MPKKRTYNFKSLQGSSSSSGKQASSSKDGGSDKAGSVNERLGELRRLEGKDAIQKKKELAEIVNQRSVPPNVRAVLGVPDSEPPKPKRGVRTRMPNRTPGPAPPQSWLKRPAWSLALTLRDGRRRLRGSSSTNDDRIRPSELLRFARMTGDEPTEDKAGPSNLLHLTLKTTALNWDLFDHEDLPALVDIPLRLRLRLLGYLAHYGPPIDLATLDALTQGNEAVRRLDLAGLSGYGSLTLHRIVKFVKQQSSKATTSASADAVVDSWDQEDSFEAALTPTLSTSRFAHLSHLSLSHPPAGASWRDLLSLSKHIPSVTHLSLAYWPRPTLTPNLATTTVSSQHSPDVQAGGSHYYSNLDFDLSEPASLLRQLSGNLLCLQWLDLEGCTEWLPALGYHGEHVDTPGGIRDGTDDMDDMAQTLSQVDAVTSIFVYNWKNIQYLNVSQGWLPRVSGMTALRKDPSAAMHRHIAEKYLDSFDPFELLRLETGSVDLYDVEKRKALMWAKTEAPARSAAAAINLVRLTHGCKKVEIDHGWVARR
ncbi:hypothetical protein M409DRAFT_26707 [Zasmidium cellare ATCC 36951]|uniref:Uncharacterized protein n=1 Tax=Zasmidium cellare ATCC 36951 TaxID=1080233 RepID=A0A6A6CAD2_ZASCE|nr:uncharacterized protein M409DRAFT_26707 [Zasmidium cellare ATCC 36951]KAF2162852.1 hypothetical protein M409DRAFT_26707 [Zasmidium cellare ATCC 36951]